MPLFDVWMAAWLSYCRRQVHVEAHIRKRREHLQEVDLQARRALVCLCIALQLLPRHRLNALKVSALRNPAAAAVRSPAGDASVQTRNCRTTDQQREGRPLLQALEHVYRPQVGDFWRRLASA